MVRYETLEELEIRKYQKMIARAVDLLRKKRQAQTLEELEQINAETDKHLAILFYFGAQEAA